MASAKFTVAGRNVRTYGDERTANSLAAAEIIAADLASRYQFVDIYRLREVVHGVACYDIVKTIRGEV